MRALNVRPKPTGAGNVEAVVHAVRHVNVRRARPHVHGLVAGRPPAAVRVRGRVRRARVALRLDDPAAHHRHRVVTAVAGRHASDEHLAQQTLGQLLARSVVESRAQPFRAAAGEVLGTANDQNDHQTRRHRLGNRRERRYAICRLCETARR